MSFAHPFGLRPRWHHVFSALAFLGGCELESCNTVPPDDGMGGEFSGPEADLGVPPEPPPSRIIARVSPVLEADAFDAQRRYFRIWFEAAPGVPPDDIGRSLSQADFEAWEADQHPLARYCSEDAFVVQFPLTETPAALLPDDGFADRLAASLTTWANRRQADLFARPAAAGATLDVDPTALCEVIATLRDETDADYLARTGRTYTGAQHMLYVGRECSFRGMALQGPSPTEAAATEAERAWHLNLLDPAALGPVDDAPPVRILLVDSGVDADAAGPLSVTPFSDAAPGRPLTPHGTQMALLLRQIAPAGLADLLDVRVMDDRSLSSTGTLARALQEALNHSLRIGDGGLTLVNLSFGWPPELTVPRYLPGRALPDGRGCAAIEAPIGEEVRHVLYAARLQSERDPAAGPVVAFAAAGNRADASEVIDAAGESALGGEAPFDRTPACRPAGFEARLFGPGDLARLPTCDREGVGTPMRLTTAIGGIDARGYPAALSNAAEPPLVAPGQSVYATAPGLEQPAEPANARWCGPRPPLAAADGPPAAVPVPSAVSGTSAAAALTTGAAALVARAVYQRHGAWPAQDALASILYDAGRPMPQPLDGSPRATEGGLEVRSVQLCRTARLIECDDYLRCALGPAPAGAPAIGRPDCLAAAEGCIGLAQCPEAPLEQPEVDVDRLLGMPACIRGDDLIGVGASAEACIRDLSCPHHDGPGTDGVVRRAYDRYSVGRLGPQPDILGCTECRLIVQGDTLSASLQLSRSLPVGTRFSEATMEFTDASGRTATLDLNTTGVSPPVAAWLPGTTVTLTKVRVGAPVARTLASWSKTRARFVSTLTSTAWTAPVRDSSPLTIVIP
ncbi:S8 family serine peptidase [Myxococcota bacterium]|nr:S8 family serine peptidase [Myxococcota bacterium]